MTRIGIYAGTFDPVHNGHIAFCTEALKVGLERIILLPERIPRSKERVTDFDHRVAMLKLAVRERPRLEVVELPHEQFLVAHTLPELKKRFGDDLAFLMGSDVVKTLADWPHVDKLLSEVALLVALRDEDTQDDIEASLQHTGRMLRFHCIPSPAQYVSSKIIKQQGLQEHLHPDVKTYAQKHALYNSSLA